MILVSRLLVLVLLTAGCHGGLGSVFSPCAFDNQLSQTAGKVIRRSFDQGHTIELKTADGRLLRMGVADAYLSQPDAWAGQPGAPAQLRPGQRIVVAFERGLDPVTQPYRARCIDLVVSPMLADLEGLITAIDPARRLVTVSLGLTGQTAQLLVTDQSRIAEFWSPQLSTPKRFSDLQLGQLIQARFTRPIQQMVAELEIILEPTETTI